MDTSAPAGLTTEDEQHLAWLAYGHYAMGALTFLCGFFPVIHLTVGIGLLSGGMGTGAPEEGMVGGIFVLVATGIIGMIWMASAATIYAGRCLRSRTKHTFVFVMAIMQCALFQPLGLVLGIPTVLVLNRPTVKAAFQSRPTSF